MNKCKPGPNIPNTTDSKIFTRIHTQPLKHIRTIRSKAKEQIAPKTQNLPSPKLMNEV